MKPSQIIAVSAVGMEAPPHAREDLIWFYCEVVGLEPPEHDEEDALLRLRSAGLELRIRFTDHPNLWAAAPKATISVRSLDDAIRRLEERRIEYERVSGWNETDRRLSLLDPAGNRVILKQEWRSGVFPPEKDPLPDDLRRPEVNF